MRTLWQELCRSRAFWLSYLREAVDFHGSETLRTDERLLEDWPCCGVSLSFSLPSDYELQLNIFPGGHRLQLSHSEIDEPLLLGTMDACQMSDVFRWIEFESVIRQLGENAGPAWARELLLSYYVAATEDCAGKLLALMRRCLEESEVFSKAEVECILAYKRRVVRRVFRWIETPELGWMAEGEDAYSLRSAGASFDFVAFREFLGTLGKSGEQAAAADGGGL